MLWKRILKRLILTIITLIGVTIIAFLIVHLTPGDPARSMLPSDATEEQVEQMRTKMGLDKSWIVQYGIYIGNLCKGDLGYSYVYNCDNATLIFSKLFETLKLALLAAVIAIVFGLVLGLLSGTHKGSPIDVFATLFALLGQSMSAVWLCILLMLVFGVNLHILPTQGSGTFAHMILPSVCMAFGFTSAMTRMLRSSMIDVLSEDYITATRARGISRFKTDVIYAFKNSLNPVITVTITQVAGLLGGSMVVENIFSYQGFGALTIGAMNNRDLQLVQSILLVGSLITLITYLLCDICYTLVDKRIKFD